MGARAVIGFVPRKRPTVIPLARDVRRCAIVQMVGRDRAIAMIAKQLYDVLTRPGGNRIRSLREAYK